MQHPSQSIKIGLLWGTLLLFIVALAVAPWVEPVLAQDAVPAVTDTATAEPTPPSPTDTPVPPTPTTVPTTEPPTATSPAPTPTSPPPAPTPTDVPGEPVNIPEPITVVLFGTGLAALSAAAAARRKPE